MSTNDPLPYRVERSGRTKPPYKAGLYHPVTGER